MRESYDFTDSKSNPYIKDLKKSVTIRLGVDVVEYFNVISKETGTPYQSLINLYLRNCTQHNRKLELNRSSCNRLQNKRLRWNYPRCSG